MSCISAEGYREDEETITRVADAIFQRLKTETDCVFMVPGGGAMFLVDALGKSGIPYVSAIFEQGAGMMAVGYAMMTGKLGVCLVTSGPGVTNALTACYAAWVESVPVLFISGQARTPTLIGDSGLRTRGIQEIDTVSVVEPITKYAKEPHDAINATAMLKIAIAECMRDRRGPCWLSVPQDIQGMEI